MGLVAAGRLPFLLLFLSFLTTFVATRAITRMIRAGVGPFRARSSVIGTALVPIVAVLFCVRKGKYSTAVLGIFLPPVAWIGAVRLARPHSAWARAHYDPARSARAEARANGFDARFGRWGLDIADLVAGRPSRPNPQSQPLG